MARPLFGSILLTVSILALERTVEMIWPLLAPFFFQITTTAIAVSIIYNTPRLVYSSLIVEPHWLKSTRDYLYMSRLFTI